MIIRVVYAGLCPVGPNASSLALEKRGASHWKILKMMYPTSLCWATPVIINVHTCLWGHTIIHMQSLIVTVNLRKRTSTIPSTRGWKGLQSSPKGRKECMPSGQKNVKCIFLGKEAMKAPERYGMYGTTLQLCLCWSGSTWGFLGCTPTVTNMTQCPQACVGP